MSGADADDRGFLLYLSFLTFLLMLQYLFFVLLEANEVEMQVLDPVFFEQILTDQAAQVDASGLGHRVVFIERCCVPLYCAKVAAIVAHV